MAKQSRISIGYGILVLRIVIHREVARNEARIDDGIILGFELADGDFRLGILIGGSLDDEARAFDNAEIGAGGGIGDASGKQ